MFVHPEFSNLVDVRARFDYVCSRVRHVLEYEAAWEVETREARVQLESDNKYFAITYDLAPTDSEPSHALGTLSDGTTIEGINVKVVGRARDVRAMAESIARNRARDRRWDAEVRRMVKRRRYSAFRKYLLSLADLVLLGPSHEVVRVHGIVLRDPRRAYDPEQNPSEDLPLFEGAGLTLAARRVAEAGSGAEQLLATWAWSWSHSAREQLNEIVQFASQARALLPYEGYSAAIRHAQIPSHGDILKYLRLPSIQLEDRQEGCRDEIFEANSVATDGRTLARSLSPAALARQIVEAYDLDVSVTKSMLKLRLAASLSVRAFADAWELATQERPALGKGGRKPASRNPNSNPNGK